MSAPRRLLSSAGMRNYRPFADGLANMLNRPEARVPELDSVRAECDGSCRGRCEQDGPIADVRRWPSRRPRQPSSSYIGPPQSSGADG